MAYIDLFAGAGGLSEGFIRAGFDAVAHIEMNPDAVNTIKTRLCYYYLSEHNQLNDYYNYLRGQITREALYALVPDDVLAAAMQYTMSDENINEIFANIDARLQAQGVGQVELIVGGPPCQAYSLAGRAKQRCEDTARANGGNVDDSRKYLYRLYCQFLQRYQPEMFVFENVPGLLSLDGGQHWLNIQAMLRAAGYQIDHRELNARNFGVPQNRRRIFIIGWRNGTQHRFPNFAEAAAPGWTIQNILNDLPPVQAGGQNNQYRRVQMHPYVAQNLRNANDVLTWHIARPHTDRDREIYRIAIREWTTNNNRLNYQTLPQELRTHKNTKDFTDRFKVVAPNLAYCHTVLAHIAKDGHYYIHPDAGQARSLTVREAARIQSFPDNYFFEGSRTSAFTQIGNAVPPLMAQAIAEALAEQLQ